MSNGPETSSTRQPHANRPPRLVTGGCFFSVVASIKGAMNCAPTQFELATRRQSSHHR
jgi:hypothetical protein